MSAPSPIPMLLWCPECGERHVDEGEFAERAHHSHACQNCGHVWRPAIVPTVGVRFLPGFKNTSAGPEGDGYDDPALWAIVARWCGPLDGSAVQVFSRAHGRELVAAGIRLGRARGAREAYKDAAVRARHARNLHELDHELEREAHALWAASAGKEEGG